MLDGQIQPDGAWLGGERSGGKVGRGTENKTPYLAAVSFKEQGHLLRVQLTLVAAEVRSLAQRSAVAAKEMQTLISGSVTQLDQMTLQNAALVEQGAAAAKSLKVQAQQLTRKGWAVPTFLDPLGGRTTKVVGLGALSSTISVSKLR